MSNQLVTIEMTEQQLATAISGLLFSCSVNIVSDTNEEYQRDLFELAKALKGVNPEIKLDRIQFLEESTYEDPLSPEIWAEFQDNMEIVSTAEFEN